MLNFSKVDVSKRIDKGSFDTFKNLRVYKKSSKILRISFIVLGIFILISFSDWTQNVVSESYVTTLKPEKRPQNINSVIAGRVEKWFVREGSYVEKGDTIIKLGEVKHKFFDPEILIRAKEQVDAKKQSLQAYEDNIETIQEQIVAIAQMQDLKLSQAQKKLNQAILKLQSDSARLKATEVNLNIAKIQFERFQQLYDKNLRSINDLEKRKVAYQEQQASYIEDKNKVVQSINNKLNAEINIISLRNEFRELLAVTNAKKQNTLSMAMNAKAKLSQLNNVLSNYVVRGDYHYILAPQDGNITKVNMAGIGEIFKENESIVTIMPVNFKPAIEMYVRPIDIPLMKKKSKVRISFDGWPSFIISGWPYISFGTYGGEIVAIDRYISSNGLYRIMVAEDPDDEPWPDMVKVGNGANAIALLNKVPTWYEFWRQLNGFPPNYYKGINSIQVDPSDSSVYHQSKIKYEDSLDAVELEVNPKNIKKANEN